MITAGKPGRAEALRNFMIYVLEKQDIWVTAGRNIALHLRKKFPYKSGHLA
jgi:hypothetical protein